MFANISRISALIYLLIIEVIMFTLGADKGGIIVKILLNIIIISIAIAPLLLAFHHINNSKTTFAASYYLSIQLFLSIAAIYIYYDAFFVHIDALNGVLFLFLPIYQGIIIFGASILHKIFAVLHDNFRAK